MASDKAVIEQQKLEPSGCADTSVKILQAPTKCGAVAAAQPPPTAAGVSRVVPAGQSRQQTSSTVTVPGLQTSSPVVVIAKCPAPGGVSANVQPQVTKAVLSQVASVNPVTTPGRAVMITVPRAAAPQMVAVTPRLPPPVSMRLPTNIHVPPGMMLIRSERGQLMLVSQQALAQVQQGPRGISGQASRILAPQVSAAAGSKSNETVTMIRMAAPPRFQPVPVVKMIGVASKPVAFPNLSAVSEQGSQPRLQAVVKETKKGPAAAVNQEGLESVKKCKNFLVTLIKLASSDSRSANMANNVRGLVRNLLEGKVEAEEFTEQLYRELKATPQPCLVPFLKKSLPAVRRLISDPQLFIQQASTIKVNMASMKQSNTDAERNFRTSQQVLQQPRGGTVRPGVTTVAQSRNLISKSNRAIPKPTLVHSGTFSLKQPFTQDPSQTKCAFKDSSGSYKEDDDINDVASMAGVNLREENAQSLTTMVGSVVQSCQDQLFLSPNPVLRRILRGGQELGVTDVGPEVVALVSHATQEYLRGLIEKLALMAEHRKPALKDDPWHAKVTDVRSQIRFLEEVETLKKKKKDEEEREQLLRLARSRSSTEDPEHQQLKQRAKELQQMEEAQLQQREANLTALAAIGPRKKRPPEQTDSQVTVLPRKGVQRVTRIMLRDLLVCMEQDRFLRRSLTLYRAML